MKSPQIDESPRTFVLILATGDELATGLLQFAKAKTGSGLRSCPPGEDNGPHSLPFSFF